MAIDTAGNVDHSVYTGNVFNRVNGQCIDLDGFHDGEVTGNSCENPATAATWPGLHFGILFGNHDPGTPILRAGNFRACFAARPVEFHCVIEQIHQHLLQVHAVAHHLGIVGLFKKQTYAAQLGFPFHSAQG